MASWPGHPITLYRGLKKENGKVVVVDVEHIAQTSMVARSAEAYALAIRQGWIHGTPQEALDAFEREEEVVSTAAAEEAYKVLSMSAKAQQEMADYEKTTPQHVPEMPEAPRKRGRPAKVKS